MIQLLKQGLAPLLSLLILMFGAGLISTFLPIRVHLEGFSTIVAGYVTSAYFAGFMIGCLRIEKFISRVGHIRAFATCASLVSVMIMLQALIISPVAWTILRLFSGIFMAGLFIIIESWLLKMGGEHRRGTVLSLYMIAFYGGQCGGQFFLNFSDLRTLAPFCITALLASFSVVPVSMTRAKSPPVEEPSLLSPISLYRVSPFGVCAAVLSGMMMGSFFGLAPIFCQDIGLTVSEIAKFMGLTILGGFILQWPIGQLSDRISRRFVLIIVSFITCFLALLIVAFAYISIPLLYILAVLFGGFSFTIYPLSISYTNDYLNTKDLVASTGGMLLAYGFGSVLGPLLAPYFMQGFGALGLFAYAALVAFVIGSFGLWRNKKRAPIPLKMQKLFKPLPRTTLQIGEFDSDYSPHDAAHDLVVVANEKQNRDNESSQNSN